MCPFQGIGRETGLERDTPMLSRDDHNQKIKLKNKQMLVNIPSKIGPLKAGNNYLQAY